MKIGNFYMKYVIGFPIKDGKVLMIKRNKHPWINKWNGAGGKIEKGETPIQAIQRELLEETEIQLEKEDKTKFCGIVTWDENTNGKSAVGMYSFISHLGAKQKIWTEERVIEEGIIAWKQLDWVTDKKNPEVADNISYFLPLMLKFSSPKRYHCVFENDVLKEVQVLSLPNGISQNKLF